MISSLTIAPLDYFGPNAKGYFGLNDKEKWTKDSFIQVCVPNLSNYLQKAWPSTNNRSYQVSKVSTVCQLILHGMSQWHCHTSLLSTSSSSPSSTPDTVSFDLLLLLLQMLMMTKVAIITESKIFLLMFALLNITMKTVFGDYLREEWQQ